ncbi:helix-turn-helix transcriptional regulator [Nocardioides sp. BYT-33-1]|uniref:helix-turn-helix transcriptional regulator n=1 Tax=Nocardioides sp. BYT-33-1 TaxID=3416952 RepID=UPI003F531FA5
MSGASQRSLTLLSLLQARRHWPGQVLAERLGVTTRTVRRDVDRLRVMGYRITAAKGPDGGYRLAAGADLPPLLFDDEQAVALAVALQNAASSGVAIEDAAQRALATVRQVLPSRLRHRVDGVRFASTPGPEPVDPEVLHAVSRAVGERTTLRFDYGSGPADAPARRAEPHELVARNGRWYVIAWDLDRGDWRTFRLDRMLPRVPTGPRFAPRAIPLGDAAAFLAARARGAGGDGAWPCVGQVVLDLPATAVVPWVRDGQVEPETDGSCLVTLGSWSWAGLLAEVVRFDASFRVVGPAPLAVAASALARRLGAAP